jgi:hypothetical protein
VTLADFRKLLSGRGAALDSQQGRALADFRRIMVWIVAIGILMVASALTYLRLTGDLDANLVIATVVGVFFSILLGCGLFAAAFFSDKSGIDQSVSDATKGASDRQAKIERQEKDGP